MKINGIEVGPFRDLMKILNFWSKALAGRRNHFQGAPSLVSVVTECGGSRKGDGLEVGSRPNAFSENKKDPKQH